MGLHTIPVIQIDTIQKHPNADVLGIVNIKGWQCVVRLEDFKPGDIAIYIPPDSVVDTSKKVFEFLKEHSRIKVRRFRGVYSEGLLIPVPPELSLTVGDDAAEALGIHHYEPPVHFEQGEQCEGPEFFVPTYDIERIQNYPNLFWPGEKLIVTEKVHGTHGRAVFDGTKLHVGTHHTWRKESDGCLWWKVVKQNECLVEFLHECPMNVVFFEVYGDVQDLTYGCKKGEHKIAVFDIFDVGKRGFHPGSHIYPPYIEGLTVPVIGTGGFSTEKLIEMAEGESKLCPGQIREGVVIKPFFYERQDLEIGRVILKAVSKKYLERSKE